MLDKDLQLSAQKAELLKNEYETRSKNVRDKMRKEGLEALLITSPENIYYLVGLNHQGYFAFTMLVFPLEGKPVLVTRTMERVTVTQQAPDVLHEGFEDIEKPEDAAARAIKKLGIKSGKIGAEEGSMFFPPKIWKGIKNQLENTEWVDASDMVNFVRMIKSPYEVELIRKAARLSDIGMSSALNTAEVGANETDIASNAVGDMFKQGSEQPGFLPLIRSTETLQFEHISWRDHELEDGEGLFVELSGSYYRYHAPLTRTVYIKSATDKAKKAAKISVDGLMAVKENLRPGVMSGDVYAAWEKVVNKGLGRDDYKRHHCGYMIGIGFPPSWSGGGVVQGLTKNGTLEIKEGMVFHAFSWITDEALAFYVTSDTVLVTKNGGEILTQTPRDVIVK